MPNGSTTSPHRPVGRLATAALLIAATALGTLGWSTTGGAQGSDTFLTSDYGTGVETDDNYCWRGWGFQLNEDVSVTALIGGGDVGPDGVDFLGAIWEGTYDADTDTLTVGDVVTEVTYPEGTEQSVPLAAPVNLTAGQVYVLGIGVSGEDDGAGVGEVIDFDPSMIPGPGNLMSTWIAPPDQDGLPRAIRLWELAGIDCVGLASEIVGASGVLAANSTGVLPAIGFAYTTGTDPTTTTAPEPTTTTTPAPGPTTTTPAGPPVTPRYTG